VIKVVDVYLGGPLIPISVIGVVGKQTLQPNFLLHEFQLIENFVQYQILS